MVICWNIDRYRGKMFYWGTSLHVYRVRNEDKCVLFFGILLNEIHLRNRPRRETLGGFMHPTHTDWDDMQCQLGNIYIRLQEFGIAPPINCSVFR